MLFAENLRNPENIVGCYFGYIGSRPDRAFELVYHCFMAKVTIAVAVEMANSNMQVNRLANCKTPGCLLVGTGLDGVHMTFTPLLFLIIVAMIVLVVFLCMAVRFCNLDQVDLSANILKLIDLRFSATGRGLAKPRPKPPRERRHEQKKQKKQKKDAPTHPAAGSLPDQ